MAKISLNAPFIKGKLFAGIETFYMGRRRTPLGAEVGAFMLSNLTLYSQRLLKDFELSAGLYNLFDKRYADPGSVEHRQNSLEQDGRTFRVKLVYRIPFLESENGR
jgi:outer membrane receptor for ferrienterochelin and colicins